MLLVHCPLTDGRCLPAVLERPADRANRPHAAFALNPPLAAHVSFRRKARAYVEGMAGRERAAEDIALQAVQQAIEEDRVTINRLQSTVHSRPASPKGLYSLLIDPSLNPCLAWILYSFLAITWHPRSLLTLTYHFREWPIETCFVIFSLSSDRYSVNLSVVLSLILPL